VANFLKLHASHDNVVHWWRWWWKCGVGSVAFRQFKRADDSWNVAFQKYLFDGHG